MLTRGIIEERVKQARKNKVLLWRFISADSPTHIKNLTAMNTMFPGPREGILEIAETFWKITCDDTLAILERVSLREVATPKPIKMRRDPRQFWLEGLQRNGWLYKTPVREGSIAQGSEKENIVMGGDES